MFTSNTHYQILDVLANANELTEQDILHELERERRGKPDGWAAVPAVLEWMHERCENGSRTKLLAQKVSYSNVLLALAGDPKFGKLVVTDLLARPQVLNLLPREERLLLFGELVIAAGAGSSCAWLAEFRELDPKGANAFVRGRLADIEFASQFILEGEGAWRCIPEPKEFLAELTKLAVNAPYEILVVSQALVYYLDQFEGRKRAVEMVDEVLKVAASAFYGAVMGTSEVHNLSFYSQEQVGACNLLARQVGSKNVAELRITEYDQIVEVIGFLKSAPDCKVARHILAAVTGAMGKESAPYVYRYALLVPGVTECWLHAELLRALKVCGWRVTKTHQRENPKARYGFDVQVVIGGNPKIIIKYEANRHARNEQFSAGDEVLVNREVLGTPVYQNPAIQLHVMEPHPLRPVTTQTQDSPDLRPTLRS